MLYTSCRRARAFTTKRKNKNSFRPPRAAEPTGEGAGTLIIFCSIIFLVARNVRSAIYSADVRKKKSVYEKERKRGRSSTAHKGKPCASGGIYVLLGEESMRPRSFCAILYRARGFFEYILYRAENFIGSVRDVGMAGTRWIIYIYCFLHGKGCW